MGTPVSTKQCAWMNESVRTAIIASRPWSLPASLVPIMLTTCLLHHTQGLLPTLAFAACAVCILCVQAAANLTNTYFDYVNGVDTKENADDRALVDSKVDKYGVLQSSVILFMVGGVCVAAVAAVTGRMAAMVGLSGILLAFFYTADPVNLKGMALGDLTVFACFGPMAMSLASLSISGSIDWMVLYLSVPMGLLTVAILHANNVRDVAADKAAKVTTVAQYLSPEANFWLYVAEIGVSYALVGALAVVLTPRLLMVAACLPWSIHLARKFKAGMLSTLPQLTAQHNLLFGALLCFGLLPPMFLARLLLGCLFYMGGANNVIMWSYNVHLVHEKVSAVVPISLGMAQALFAISTVTQMVTAVCFILGFQCRLMAQLMLCWLVPVTLFVHNFWTIPDESPPTYLKTKREGSVAPRGVPTFPTEFDNDFVHFFKNVGMIGGLAVFLEAGL